MSGEEPFSTPLCATVAGTCRLLRVSRAGVYRMLNDGRLRATKCGVRALVLMDSINSLVATSPAYQGRGRPGGGPPR